MGSHSSGAGTQRGSVRAREEGLRLVRSHASTVMRVDEVEVEAEGAQKARTRAGRAEAMTDAGTAAGRGVLSVGQASS
jgi:hypothetical protein